MSSSATSTSNTSKESATSTSNTSKDSPTSTSNMSKNSSVAPGKSSKRSISELVADSFSKIPFERRPKNMKKMNKLSHAVSTTSNQTLILHGVNASQNIYVAWATSMANPNYHTYLLPLIQAWNRTVRNAPNHEPLPLFPPPEVKGTQSTKQNMMGCSMKQYFGIDWFTDRRDASDLNANQILLGNPSVNTFPWKCFVWINDDERTLENWLESLCGKLNDFITWCHTNPDVYGSWQYNPSFRTRVENQLLNQPIAHWVLDVVVVQILLNLYFINSYDSVSFRTIVRDKNVQMTYFGGSIFNIEDRCVMAFAQLFPHGITYNDNNI